MQYSEISLTKSNQLKTIAILMMLFLHLFNQDYRGVFEPLIFVGNQPLSYYLSLFCDACVPIFAFISGYGLYYKYITTRSTYKKDNLRRIRNLYIPYWIIMLLFAVVLGLILGSKTHPGSWLKFLLNYTAVDPSYNGAWWFFTTYVLFVLTSSFWFRLLDQLNPYLMFISLLVLYVLAFYFRIYKTDIFDAEFSRWLHRQSALYFCTLFQFLLGAMTLKFRWNSTVSSFFDCIKYRSTFALIGIGVLVVFHALIPNFIVAPFTGLGFIFLFMQIRLPQFVNRSLDFLIPHSTNLWLIHMFFYMIFFPDFIYSAKYVLPIFILLILLSVLSSYIVKLIERPIFSLVNLKP